MFTPNTPHNEKVRQDALDATGLVDTAPTERFDRYTRLVQRLFKVPIALVSLVDRDRQWFKSRQGLAATETPRDISFCGHAILENELLVVENATMDQRFHDNPLVTGDPSIRFYAGCPIETDGGHKIGTLCLIDNQPRKFSDEDKEALRDIGAMVSDELATIRLASIDDLTDLSNRRSFNMLADQALKVASRHNHDSSLVMIDLDGFKEINDQLGHETGDEALRKFADLMRVVFRESDIMARIGGDEFCVLLTETGAEVGADVVNRFREAVDQFNHRSAGAFQLNFSVGIVQFDPQTHVNADCMLRDADAMMYERKRAKCA